MEIQVLQWVRLLVPGIMLYLLAALLCWATRWCELSVPKNWEDVAKLTAVLVLGVLYNFTDLSEWSNRKYYDQVNYNLMQKLTEPFKNDPQVPKSLSWGQIRSVFYHIVDSDESLKVQAKLAYWNGALWTSAADLRVVALFGLIALFSAFFLTYFVRSLSIDETRVVIASFALLIIFSSSFYASEKLTARHIEIGNRQVEYIRINHLKDLREGLIQAGS
jgi:hypothetical protein